MNYSMIMPCDIANGEGVRVTLFVSGCRNHCKGCFQPETWSFQYGKPFTRETEEDIIRDLMPDYISGLTLLGGDPFEEENQDALISLLRKAKQKYPQKTVWAFTGYLLDDLLPGGKKHTDVTDEMLSYIDVLIDGPFVEEKKDLTLKFRGSSNQRIIDLGKFRKTGRLQTV